jgi:hypothetical protein
MHVARKPVELCDQHRAFCLPRLGPGCGQFRPALKGVCPLAGLDLYMLGKDLDSFGFSKALDSRFLSLDAYPLLP